MDPAATAFRLDESGIRVSTSLGHANAEWATGYVRAINGLPEVQTQN